MGSAGGADSNVLWSNPELGGISLTPIVMRKSKLWLTIRSGSEPRHAARRGKSYLRYRRRDGEENLGKQVSVVYLSDVPA